MLLIFIFFLSDQAVAVSGSASFIVDCMRLMPAIYQSAKWLRYLFRPVFVQFPVCKGWDATYSTIQSFDSSCEHAMSLYKRYFRNVIIILFVQAGLVLTACGDDNREPSPEVDQGSVPSVVTADEEVATPPEQYPAVEDILPEPMSTLWLPWAGDIDGMIDRRIIRVLVPFGGYQYYYVRGRPRGAIVELLQKMEQHLNKELERRHIKVYVVPIPVSRDQLIPFLLGGHGDLIAADLTVTPARSELVTFSRPLLKGINEVVVTGPASPPIKTLGDLAGQEIFVRESSSYFEHLQKLNLLLAEDGLEEVLIRKADEMLEAEDLLEMVNAGMIPATVLDDYKAEYWKTVFPNIEIHNELSINDDGVIAWAMKKESNKLAEYVERFLRKNGRGTLVGNDTFNRYLADSTHVRCSMSPNGASEISELVHWFQYYGDEFGYDWLMLGAQGYQESHLKQSRRSHAGAVGVMQIKPSTAADPNVGVDDVTVLQNNIHAGAKYMRFLSDRYFSDGMDGVDQWLFSLAAYNAGPARVAKLRKEASESGLNRNLWFGNVEIIAGKRIGRETVNYVSSIYKYYVGYKLTNARLEEGRERYGTELTGCSSQSL
jgi:membrane-bound lytic murein transglycosylase MltF